MRWITILEKRSLIFVKPWNLFLDRFRFTLIDKLALYVAISNRIRGAINEHNLKKNTYFCKYLSFYRHFHKWIRFMNECDQINLNKFQIWFCQRECKIQLMTWRDTFSWYPPPLFQSRHWPIDRLISTVAHLHLSLLYMANQSHNWINQYGQRIGQAFSLNNDEKSTRNRCH